MLAEELGLVSSELERFDHSGLRRAGPTLGLAREPALVEIVPGLSLLGGPPSERALFDAVARGIAGVLLADRFDFVVTDLGAGPELTRTAVGGVLNPADVCVVLDDGTLGAARAAVAIEQACSDRGVRTKQILNRRGRAADVADSIVETARTFG
jgi:MinD-like ATPase involved in chromosome partitioning or flagellar assembly